MEIFILVLLISPGMLTSLYFCKLKGISLKSMEFIVFSIIFSFIIFVFVVSLSYLRGHKDVPTIELFSIMGNAARYGILSIILSFALPNILLFFESLKKKYSL